MFCSLNDIAENNSTTRYFKGKPKFEVVGDKLVLINTPVPQNKKVSQSEKGETHHTAKGPGSFKEWTKYLIFQSHFLSDVHFRLIQSANTAVALDQLAQVQAVDLDFALTREIIRNLHNEVTRLGGQLTIVRIPVPTEFMTNERPAHIEQLRAICELLEIDYLDLAPHFKAALLRTYFRAGVHWNRYGHKLAADEIYQFLVSNGL